VAGSRVYSLDPDYEVVAEESDLVAVVVRKVGDPNFPFLKINNRQISCVIFLRLFQSNLEVEVGLASLRDYGGDCVAAVVVVAVAVVAVNDDGGVAVQLLVVTDDGWAEQGGPSVGTLQLFNNLVQCQQQNNQLCKLITSLREVS
jgi:hypothetical protein